LLTSVLARSRDGLNEFSWHSVAKRGAEIVVAHLLSRDELWRHHSTHPAVAQDRLPDADMMRQLCIAAGLTIPDIRDEPGLYLARAAKL